MTVYLSSFAGAGSQFFDSNGDPLTGGLIYSYAAGTTTPAMTYTTSLGNVANSNPIVLDAAGRTTQEIWLTASTTYKFILKTSTGVTIGTYDNIPGINDATSFDDFIVDLANTSDAAKGDALVGFRQADAAGVLATSVGSTVHVKLQEYVSVRDFGASPSALAADNLTAFNNAIAYAKSSGKKIYVPAGTYNISSTVVMIGAAQSGASSYTGKAPVLFGDGRNNTILDFGGLSAEAFRCYGWSGGLEDLTIKNCDIGIYASVEYGSAPVAWNFKDLFILDVTSGMQIRGGYFNKVSNVHVAGFTDYGIQLNWYSPTSDRSNVNYIENCQFYNGNPIPGASIGIQLVNAINNTFINNDTSGCNQAIVVSGISKANQFLDHYEERCGTPITVEAGTTGNTFTGFISTPIDAVVTNFFGGGNIANIGGVQYTSDSNKPNLLINSGLEGLKYEPSIYGPAYWDFIKDAAGDASGTLGICGVGQADTTCFAGNYPMARGSRVAWKSDGSIAGAGLIFPEQRENHASYLTINTYQAYIAIAMIKVVSGNGPRIKIYDESNIVLAQSEKATTTAAYDGWRAVGLYVKSGDFLNQDKIRFSVRNDTGEAGVWYVDDVYFLPAANHVVTYRTKAFDLSAAASSDYLMLNKQDSMLYAVNYIYTETSSANTGVDLKVYATYGGTYPEGLISTYTSEVSKTRGYVKTDFINALSNPTFDPSSGTNNEVYIVDCAGGKTGTGEIVVEYMSFVVG